MEAWDKTHVTRAKASNPTPLQSAVSAAIDAAPEARDFYDREIQRLTGTKGKPLYDIERGKTLQPSAERLKLYARVLGLPEDHFLFLDPRASVNSTARPFAMEGASEARMRPDVPIYGTALGAEEVIEGEAVEQTYLNTGDVVGYLRRPVILDGRTDVYGIYVQGSSMSPRFRDGDTAFVERRPSARIGDDVVVYLRGEDHDGGDRTQCVLIKELVRKSASYVELKQHQPMTIFRIDSRRVERIDRVIPWNELVA